MNIVEIASYKFMYAFSAIAANYNFNNGYREKQRACNCKIIRATNEETHEMDVSSAT